LHEHPSAGGLPFPAGMHATSVLLLEPVLTRQHGVISLRQVVDAGCDRELPAREVAAGRWQRLARVVYAPAGQLTLMQRAWATQLVGGDDAIVSGPLACQLQGVPDTAGVRGVALVAAACHRQGEGDYLTRRTSRLPDWTDYDGVRVACAARAVVDACRLSGSLRDVRGLVCGALNAKHTSYEALSRERAAEPRAGLALLGHALQDWADGARSAPEAEVADELRDDVRAGRMPPFLLNPKLYVDDALVGASDVYVPGCALGGEVDSRRHHGSPQDLDATLERHAAFEAAGIRLEHVTPARFRRNPALWTSQFASIATARGPSGDPSGLRIEPVGPLQPVPGRRRRR
jgi:hypothetical protein